MDAPKSPDRLIRETERRRITGVSRTTWWRMERQGLAPARRRISTNAVGWLESELLGWLAQRQPVSCRHPS